MRATSSPGRVPIRVSAGPPIFRACVLSLVALAAAPRASAHPTGLSYLRVRVDGTALAVELDLGLGDAAAALGLATAADATADSDLAAERLFGRVSARADELEARVRAGLGLWQDGAACALAEGPTDLARAEETGFARLRLRARCPAAIGVLGIEWRLPFASDPEHRTLVSVAGGATPQSAILSARRQRVDLRIGAPR